MIFIHLSMFFPVYNAQSMGMGLLPYRGEGVSITGVRYYGLNDMNGILFETNIPVPLDISYFGAGAYQEFSFYTRGVFSMEDIDLVISPYFLVSRYPGHTDPGGKIDLGMEYTFLKFRFGFTFRNAIGYIDGGAFRPEQEIFALFKERYMETGLRATLIEGGIDIGWGMQVDVNSAIFRLGFRTDPFVPGFGFGVRVNGIAIDMGFESHPVLGFTESITIRRM